MLQRINNLTNIPVNELEDAFFESEPLSELEVIIIYLNRKYNLSFTRNVTPLIFILTIIKIPLSTLRIICADEEFYQGLTLLESCEIVFRKILGGKKMSTYNGFPKRFNYVGNNNIQKMNHYNVNWLPINHSSIDNYDFLFNITVTTEEILLYHVASWTSIFNILRGIEPRSRDSGATDFGLYNFYTNNSFKAAYHWSKRFEQSGIIIF